MRTIDRWSHLPIGSFIRQRSTGRCFLVIQKHLDWRHVKGKSGPGVSVVFLEGSRHTRIGGFYANSEVDRCVVTRRGGFESIFGEAIWPLPDFEILIEPEL